MSSQKMKSEEELNKIRESIPKRITFDLEELKHFILNEVNYRAGQFKFDFKNEKLIYDCGIIEEIGLLDDYKLSFEIYNG